MGKGEEIPKTKPAEIEKLIEQIRGTNLEPGSRRQASAGAREGVKGQSRTLAARAPLHALVRRVFRFTDCMPEPPQEGKFPRAAPTSKLSSNLGRKRVQQNLRMADVVAFRQQHIHVEGSNIVKSKLWAR